MVDAGVARLWSMQTRNGGLAYWPGGSKPNRWVSAYVGQFLLDAQQAGYEIDDQFAEPLLAYLQAVLDGSQRTDHDDGPDDNVRAQICRVLAGFQETPRGWLARLTERADDLDTAGRAHLAAAWAFAGRKDMALQVLEGIDIGRIISTTTTGRLTSQVRQDAVLLHVLLDVAPDHAWAPVLAARLEAARRPAEGRYHRQWGTTVNNASALSALTRYQASGAGGGRFAGVIDAGELGRFQFDHTKPAAHTLKDVNAPITVTITDMTSADGPDAHAKAFVCLTTEGLVKQGSLDPYDRQLEVRRTWTDLQGKPVDPTKLTVGDLIIVDVTLKSTLGDDATVHNIAVVDALPGGLEVEHPRLATSTRHAGGPTAGAADRVEFLDDRVVLFASARSKPQRFTYALRVTSAGRFAAPPIQASCMYDPSIASLHGGGRVEVRK